MEKDKIKGLPQKESQIAFFVIIASALLASTIGIISLILGN